MSIPVETTINGLCFELTCSMCPEQYDVFDGPKQVGYVRLRWGHFTVDYPDCMEEELLSLDLDDEQGCFDNEIQRLAYLTKAALAIRARMEEEAP
jgi:hypothetical protein